MLVQFADDGSVMALQFVPFEETAPTVDEDVETVTK
jgi:hypothetical protein